MTTNYRQMSNIADALKEKTLKDISISGKVSNVMPLEREYAAPNIISFYLQDNTGVILAHIPQGNNSSEEYKRLELNLRSAEQTKEEIHITEKIGRGIPVPFWTPAEQINADSITFPSNTLTYQPYK